MQIFAIAGNTGGGMPNSGSAGELSGTSTVSPMAAHSETLLQLCRLWPHIHKSPPPEPPPFCADILRNFYHNNPSVYDDRFLQNYGTLRNSETGERVVGIDVMDNLHFSGRSLSLIGVLGGVLFILLMIAFVTCIKHRKRLRDEEGDGLNLDAISTQLRHLNQARASQHLLSMLGALPDLQVSPPPDYETVVKQREKEQEEWENLPTYSEAIGDDDNGVLETVFEEPRELEPGADEILENREVSRTTHDAHVTVS